MKQFEVKIGEEFSEDMLVKELQTLYFILTRNYEYNLQKIIGKLGEDILIPASIFNKKLSSFEAITKYLKENLNLSFNQISKLLKRSYRAVWGAYQSSLSKFPQILTIEKTPYFILTSIFNKSSLLKTICTFLKNSYNLNYKQVADIMKRDQRTIWVVVNRK